MKIRIASDIHLDWGKIRTLPVVPDEAQMTLILAGDVTCIDKWYKSPNGEVAIATDIFMNDVTSRYKNVIVILGNHEFYNGEWKTTISRAREMYGRYPNVHFLEKEAVFIDDVWFVGGTLWTDCAGPYAAMDFQRMSDSRIIRVARSNSYHRVSTSDLVARFRETSSWCFKSAKTFKDLSNKVVMVFHHSPCTKSIHQNYGGDSLNAFYASDCSDDILSARPNLIVHGHTHHFFDYMIDDTRLICNPMGYIGDRSEFDVNLIVEI